ncbi:MAG: hypothetical protein H6706_05860 [Myxococcales bacterium]|nr:hypothetical protein [Myxococcales bacterium]
MLRTFMAAALLLATGCRGGGRGIDDITPGGGAGGAGGAGGGGTTDAGMTDAGGDLVCDTPQADFPRCPLPADDPFGITAEGFHSDANTTLAGGPAAYAYENQDVYGTPEQAQSFVGRLARGAALSPTGLPGEPVTLLTWSETGDWYTLGDATTDERGYYRLALQDADHFGVGDHVTYAISRADATCAPHGVFLWPAGTRLVITDIDGTLTLADAELTRQIGDPTYVPRANDGALELMQAWAEKGYKVVYLTARPHTFRLQTRAWLDDLGFPYGPVITADSLVFGESARTYKRAAIQELVDDFGWIIEAAYGNASSDIQAYEDAGHPKDRTFIIGEEAGRSGTTAVPDQDFGPHVQSYVRPYAEARQPAGLAPVSFCR